jgi:hypothetical protein
MHLYPMLAPPQIADRRQAFRVASWLAISCFGDVICKLGQRLRGSNAYAAWNAGPLEDPRAYRPRPFGEIAPNTIKAYERLVDAVYLPALAPSPAAMLIILFDMSP